MAEHQAIRADWGTVERATDASAADPPSLSPAQRRLWFLDRFDTSESAYNIARATRLQGPLDVVALRQAHERVSSRHEILRTRYPEVDGVPSQAIDPPGPVDWESVDLSGTESPQRDADLAAYLTAEGEAAFDLEQGPVWRVRLVRLGDDDHVLLTVIHHIAADGWSFPILRSEVSEFYRAAVTGSVAGLPELEVQYRHFAERQLAAATDGSWDLSRQFWSGLFADDPEPIVLPWDRPRTRERTAHGAWVEVPLPTATEDRLRQAARRLDASPFQLGLALLAGFLRRFASSDDVVIGIPSVERTWQPSQQLIGPFVNTLPIRLSISRVATMWEVVASARSAMLDVLDHADLPFEEIVRLSAPRRDPSHAPLFQVMYQYRDGAFRTGYGLPDIAEHVVQLPGSTSKFDLVVEMGGGADRVGIGLNYSTDLFDEGTGRAVAEAFSVFADTAIADLERPHRLIPIVHPWQREWLVDDLNDTTRPYPSGVTLPDLYSRVVSERPEELAIEADGLSLTFAELDQGAARIAARLDEAGVVPGEAIGLRLGRSATFVASTLAILRLGAVYVPLDPSYPEDRVRQMTDAAGIRYVIAESNQRSWADVELEQIAAEAAPLDAAQQPAYVMFTSGSTGIPKGVIVPHRAIARLVCGADYVALGPGDVVAHLSNTSFDAATFEIWGALLNGATLAIIDQDTALSPRDLSLEIRDRSITTMFMTTALFNLVARRMPSAFSSVRDVLFGGERCDPAAARDVLNAGPPQRLLHVYGPTETTTFASWHEVRDVPMGAATIPIGQPIANTTLHILDPSGQLVPPGIAGELHIGGDGVAIGYMGDPELSHRRFVPDPFSAQPWARLYRTGDLVRRRDDGEIEFLGRNDRQLKLRGFRVEPAEIEIVLSRHPDVAGVVVQPVEVAGDMQIAAWVESRPQRDVSEAALRAHLSSQLPSFMVPAFITILPELPMNPNGKIAVDLLAIPAAVPHGISADTGTEATLIEIFTEVLGVDGVGRSDSFFDLGGHSLLAVELVAQIDNRLGARVPLAALFECPTPSALAAEIEMGSVRELEESLVPMSPGGRDRPVYLLHHPSGTVIAYQALVEHLGRDRPVYGIQAAGVDGVDRPLRSVEEMAARYVEIIVDADGSGDYRLVGHSLGGLLAWETARQLQSSGGTVSMLALLDTNAREGTWRRNPGDPNSGTAQSALRVGRRLLGDLKWGSRMAWYSTRNSPIPPDLARIRQVRASSRAFDLYRPGSYDGSVTYYLATAGSGSDPGKVKEQWGAISRELEIVPVPGNHSGPDSLLNEPNVSVLGHELVRRLESLARSGAEPR